MGGEFSLPSEKYSLFATGRKGVPFFFRTDLLRQGLTSSRAAKTCLQLFANHFDSESSAATDLAILHVNSKDHFMVR